MKNIRKCIQCDALTISGLQLCKKHEKNHRFVRDGLKQCKETVRNPSTIKVQTPYSMIMPNHIKTDTHVAVPADLRTLDGLNEGVRDMLKPMMQNMIRGLEIVKIPDQVNILKHNDITYTTWGVYVRKSVWNEECDKPAPRGTMYVPKHMQ